MIDLKELGITEEELINRVVDKIAYDFSSAYMEDNAGYEEWAQSPIGKRIEEEIFSRLDIAVSNFTEKHIMPKLNEIIDNLVLEETNQWGEKKGTKLTLTEYILKRGEDYMLEEVNYDGKTKKRDPYSWRPDGTRISYMVDRYFHFHLEAAMKKILDDANSILANGIQEAVKIKMSEIQNSLKVNISTKK